MFPNNVADWEMPKEKEMIAWEDETQNETVTDSYKAKTSPNSSGWAPPLLSMAPSPPIHII